VKLIIKKIVGLVLCFVLCGVASAAVIESGTINMEIPDNSDLGIYDTLSFSGIEGIITNISVSVLIEATDDGYAFNGDLYLYLQHDEDSSIAILLNRTGKTADDSYGYFDDGFDVTFTLLGDDIHTYGGNDGETLTGEWGADGRLVDPDEVVDTDERTAMLDVFLDTEANGDWTLFAADLNSGGTAKITSWSITVDVVPEPYVASFLGLFGVGLLIVRRIFC
jgi:subtilisin-like proprotein convertase family protein